MAPNQEKIKIRPLKTSDWERFFALFKEIVTQDFSHYPPEAIKLFLEPENLRRKLGKRKEIILAFKGEELVGFIIPTFGVTGLSYVNWLGVKKDRRFLGVGKTLVKAWQMYAKRRKCHKLRAQTSHPTNKGFYQKQGFELEGIKKKDNWGLDYFVYVKIIGEPKKI